MLFSELDAFKYKSPLEAGFWFFLKHTYHHGRKKVCVEAVMPP
jgi:hypothetical protein